jgi:hypothetical protein
MRDRVLLITSNSGKNFAESGIERMAQVKTYPGKKDMSLIFPSNRIGTHNPELPDIEFVFILDALLFRKTNVE